MATVAENTDRAIKRGEVYPLADFMRRAGLGRHAMRTARSKGLRVRRTGNRGYVVGDDWLDYLDGQSSDST